MSPLQYCQPWIQFCFNSHLKWRLTTASVYIRDPARKNQSVLFTRWVDLCIQGFLLHSIAILSFGSYWPIDWCCIDLFHHSVVNKKELNCASSEIFQRKPKHHWFAAFHNQSPLVTMIFQAIQKNTFISFKKSFVLISIRRS